MFLEIENIGQIQNVIVEMKGITVIAGNNNTGKSTIGKILYCVFNAFCDFDNTVQTEKEQRLESIIVNAIDIDDIESYSDMKNIIRDITKSIDSPKKVQEILQNFSNKKTMHLNKEDHNSLESIAEQIQSSYSVSNVDIQKTILTRFLRNEFGKQINHVNYPDKIGSIVLSIKDNKLEAYIQDNECVKVIDNICIRYQALYIDTPFILDRINDFLRTNPQYKHSNNLLKSLRKHSNDNNIIEEVLVKNKFNTILSHISNITNGDFKENNGRLMFQETKLNKPIGFSSLSTGIKQFLTIKRLLESGEIKERGVLILDEPEVHLHPEWQVKFAELLVLLQKQFNLTILLTTHSPYFLNAIEIYSQNHKISDKCNYYLSKNERDVSKIEDVSKNINSIYKQLSEPFQKLEKLRYESV